MIAATMKIKMVIITERIEAVLNTYSPPSTIELVTYMTICVNANVQINVRMYFNLFTSFIYNQYLFYHRTKKLETI